MTPEETRAAADSAAEAMQRHLGPAFEIVEAHYLDRLKTLAVDEPWATDKIKSLSFALQISQSVRGQIEAVIAGGEVAAHELTRKRRMEAMSPERRKILGIPL